MKRANSTYILGALLVLLPSCTYYPPAKGYGEWASDPSFFTTLKQQETDGNGIEVGEPKIYDDASLRLMLDQARLRLAAINGFNEGTLTSHLGALNGSRIDQSQFGLQVGVGGLPGISTVANGATTQTTTNSDLPQGSTVPGSTVVTTAPTQSVTTTVSPVSPPAPPVVPTGLSFSPPTGITGSALDVLNEEMQLSSEVEGLQLLLEGSLSDRFVKNQHIIKPRTTIGFPISLTPQQRYRNAVAVVEVEVETAKQNLSSAKLYEPPAITALLPREKTYNVAAITDRSNSIGAGAVIGTVGIGGSFFSGHKTLYVVQDQDTVAIQRSPDPAKKDATSFAWEFRPVLGQEFVRGGMKQTFVQLALPIADTPCFGTIHVRTYWRRFDQKSGITGKAIKDSILTHKLFAIPQYDLTPTVKDATYQDLGDGTVLVFVKGSFLNGTYVQLGPTRYDVNSGLRMEDEGLTFIAPAAALARWTGQVISRSGKKADILNVAAQEVVPQLDQFSCIGEHPSALPTAPAMACPFGSIEIKDIRLSTLDENTSEVRVAFADVTKPLAQFPDGILIDIGHKIFGLTDTQVTRDIRNPKALVLSAAVPTSLLVANPQVRAFRLFWAVPSGDISTFPNRDCFDKVKPLDAFGLDSTVEHLVLASVDKKGNASYLLYGNGLLGVKVLAPKHVKLSPVDKLSLERLLLLTVSKNDLQTTKKLLLQKADGSRPVVLDLPVPEAAKPTPSNKVTLDSPVIQNTDIMEASVEKADNLISVKMGDKSLQIERIKGKDSVLLKNLRADGVTSEQKTQTLTFAFKDGTKTTVKLEVVAARVGLKK